MHFKQYEIKMLTNALRPEPNGTHLVGIIFIFAFVSVTIRGITWFALGVKNEVFCIAQKQFHMKEYRL